MKKKIVVMGMAVCMAFGTTACGGQKNVELGQYTGLSVEYECNATEVTEGHVYAQVWNELSQYAEEVKDKNYKAQLYDKVDLDYMGLKDGVAFENGTASGAALVLGSGSFIDGFEEGLVGCKKGESRSLDLKFPDNYKNSAELAGQAVVFKTKVNKIYRLPELTEEFMKKNLKDYKTGDEYMAAVKKDLEEQLNEYVKTQKETAVWDKIMADVKVNSYPEERLKNMIQDVTDYREYYYQYQYGVTVAQYLEQTGESQEEYDKSIEKEAKEVLAQRMTAEAIAKKEKIEVSEEEFEAKVEEYMKSQNIATREELFEKAPEDEIRNEILTTEVKDFVVENNDLTLKK